MLKINAENRINFPGYKVRKLRKLVLKYKNTFVQEQPQIASSIEKSADIREGIIKASQKKIKSAIMEFFVPYIEKNAQIAARNKGVSIQDYTQNLYLKFFENLENIVQNEKFHLTALYRPLYDVDCTEEDYIYTDHSSLTDLTPQEELENSYSLDDVTFMQKAQIITDILKRTLTPKEFHIFSLKADGNSYKKIAEIEDQSTRHIESILYKSHKKLNKNTVRLIINNILLNNYSKEDLIAFEQNMLNSSKNIYVPDFDSDEIWETVKKNRGRLNVRKELDIMLKTQTYYKELLNNKSTQTKIRKKIEANPDFMITLKLDKKCNKNSFIRSAKRISCLLFGKNIFKFVE